MTTINREDAAQIIMNLIDTPVLNTPRGHTADIRGCIHLAQEVSGALSTGEQIILRFAAATLGRSCRGDITDLWLIDERCRATILETFTRLMVG